MKWTRYLTLFCLLCSCFWGHPNFAQDQEVLSAQLVWKGRSLSLESPLLKQNGVILAPLRELIPYIGGQMVYSRREDSYTLTLASKQSVVIYPNLSTFRLNLVAKTFPTPATNIDGVMYVPLEIFLKTLGYEVTVMSDRIFVGNPPQKSSQPTLWLDTAVGPLPVTELSRKSDGAYGNLDVLFKAFHLPLLGVVPIEKTLQSAGFWVHYTNKTHLLVCSQVTLIPAGKFQPGVLARVYGPIPFNEITQETLTSGHGQRFVLPFTHITQSNITEYAGGDLQRVSLVALSPTASCLEVRTAGDFLMSDLLPQGTRAGDVRPYSVLTDLSETYLKNGVKITLNSKGRLRYHLSIFEHPNRMVIDLQDMVTHLPSVLSPKSDRAPYRRIRTSQFQFQPAIARVVIDLDDKATFTVSRSYNRLSLTFPTTVSANRITLKAKPKPKPVLPLEGKLIVIDPGHGGDDPGAIGSDGSYEKEFTIDISRRLERALTEAGAHVMMCRTGDQNPSLEARTVMANVNHADALLSVHINSFFSPFSNGSETYYYKYKDEALAALVHREIVGTLHLQDKGTKRARLYVLRNSTMPAVLVEPLFITNKDELLMLEQPYVRQKIADAVFRGTVSFFKTSK